MIKNEFLFLLKDAKDLFDERGPAYVKNFKKFRNKVKKYSLSKMEKFLEFAETEDAMQGIRKADDDIIVGDEDIKNEIKELAKNIRVLGKIEQDNEVQEEIDGEIDIGVDGNEAQERADERVGALIKGIDKTEQEKVKSIISRGLDKQKSLEQIKGDVKKNFKNFSDFRASMIARTETASALEGGKEEQFKKYEKEFGRTGVKRAKTQRDDRVRESHRENEKAGWIPRNNSYPGTGDMHPPFGVNCRCNNSNRLFSPDEVGKIFKVRGKIVKVKGHCKHYH